MSEKPMTFNTNETLSAVFMHDNSSENFDKFSDLSAVLESHQLLLTLQENISHKFKNQSLLIEALAHSSFGHEKLGDSTKSYERLEFLGDSVLGLIVTDSLQEKFPTLAEGQLSKLRASLVNEQSLGNLASSISLEKMILLGKGELQNQGHTRSSILCDVFESIIGAIYKDSSFEQAKKSFSEIISKFEKNNNTKFFDQENLFDFDGKTRLQELTMSLYKCLPVYKSTQLSNGHFEVVATVEDRFSASGEFSSKKKGEQSLAKKLIEEINKNAKRSTHVN
ncbi:ribonuclease III [Halobacteriovorax sp. JY17]|uniref:ribonuclease III n=1 Tax=Halobacteriovorax sp. JY17 TaxID=2014617 RepID=UPI0025C11DBD|nr:ribonuclease III [Halobacteriovorax sp. JY17]